MEIEWDRLDEAGWTALADAAGFVPFQQGWHYGAAAERCGARVRRAVIGQGDKPVAIAQLLDRRGCRLVARGPLWLAPLAAPRKRAVLRRLACAARLTVATPDEAFAGPGLVPLVTSRHHAVWDLRPEAPDLRAGLQGKWRNALVAAERTGLHTSRDREDALGALLAAEAAQRTARGYRALPAAFTRELTPGALRLWDWRQGGQPGAAMAFVRHGMSATYHLGWAGPDARAAGVHRAMLWTAAMDLRAEGVRWLDLGDVNTEDAPGLARFKLGTGAGLHRLGPTVWVLPG